MATPSVDDLCEAVTDMLHRADNPSADERKSIGALIIAIDTLMEVVKRQQAEIERLTSESNHHVH